MRPMNQKQEKGCRWAFMVACAVMVFFGILFSGSASLAGDMLKMGLLEEPKTLNVWRATDAWSNKVLGLLYQPLYVRDPKTLELTPWLAAEQPLFDEKDLSYTVKLRPAKWSDGTDLTSDDVAFTGNFIKEFKIPQDYSKWNFISKIETPDKQTVKFYLKEPQATFLTRTLTTRLSKKRSGPIGSRQRKRPKSRWGRSSMRR